MTTPTLALPQLPEKYQYLSPYIIPLAALMAAAILAMLVLVPTISDVITLKSEVDSNAERAKLLSAKVKILRDIDQARLTADLAKTDEALPTDKDVAGTLSTLNQIAAGSGSTIDTAQLVSAGKSAEKNALDFQVIVKGNFATIKGFLTKVETARRVMVVKSINISVGEAGKLAADLSITGYYEPAISVNSFETALPERGAAQEKVLADLEKRTIYIPPATTPSISGRSDPFSAN